MEIISRHSLISDFLSNANTYTDIYIDETITIKKLKLEKQKNIFYYL